MNLGEHGFRAMLEQSAIDEEDLEKMKADFFRLTLMIQTYPVQNLWRLIRDLHSADS